MEGSGRVHTRCSFPRKYSRKQGTRHVHGTVIPASTLFPCERCLRREDRNPFLLTYHLRPLYQLTPYPIPYPVDTNEHKDTIWTDIFGLHTL